MKFHSCSWNVLKPPKFESNSKSNFSFPPPRPMSLELSRSSPSGSWNLARKGNRTICPLFVRSTASFWTWIQTHSLSKFSSFTEFGNLVSRRQVRLARFVLFLVANIVYACVLWKPEHGNLGLWRIGEDDAGLRRR